MIKNKFKDDYQASANGTYSYVGSYYILPLDEKQKKQTNWMNIGFGVCFLVIEILAGMINQDSSRTFWIFYPYIFLFLPEAYMLIGAYTYAASSVRMERADYLGSIVRMRRSCMAVIVLSAVNVVLDIVFLALHFKTIQTGKEILYMACFFLTAVLGVCYGRLYDRFYTGVVIEKA